MTTPEPINTTKQANGGHSNAEALALGALGWILTDERRAERLLSLTGLTPERLRHGIEERAVQAAVLEFLSGHEPDLVLAADALNVEPAAIIAAHRELSE